MLQQPDNYDEASPQSAELFHLIVENIKDYAIFMTDAEGRIISWNPGVERLLGYTENEIVGQSIAVIFTPEDAAANVPVREMETAAQTGRSEDKRWHQRKDGSRFWANGLAMPLKTGDGALRGYAKVMRDDTAHKLAEENLEQVLSGITDYFYRFDRDFRYTYVNRAMTEKFGIAEKEFLSKTLWELFPDADGNNFHAEAARALEEQETIVFENYYAPLDRWFENRIYPSKDGLSVFTSDITTRKRAEERLRQSEEKYRALFDSIDEGFCVIEVLFDADEKANDYRFLEINPSFENLTGISAEDALRGKTIRELVPNFEEKWFEIYGRVARTGEPTRFVEGSEAMNRWFDVYAFRVGEMQERKIAVLFNNITGRKLNEIKLRESEERMRLATRAAKMYSWEIDLQTQATVVSENFAEVVGFSSDIFPASFENAIAELIHPEDAPKAFAAINEAIEGNGNLHVEYRFRTPETGEIQWLEARATVVRDHAGTPLRIVGIAQNITERKRAEEKVRESEERYRSIVNQTIAGIAEVDLTGKFIIVNDRLSEMVGYTREELLGMRMQNITHTDDLPRNLEQFKRLAKDGTMFDIEKRYVRKDGSIVWVQNYVSIIRDAAGEPHSIVAVINDVTNRKRAEESLNHQKILLESLTESVLDGIIIVSPEGKILHYNRHFLDIWNFPAEIIESKSDERALEWAAEQTMNPQAFLERVSNVYQQPDKSVREELPMKDGRVYERFGAPILDGDKWLGWVWTFRDITERKRTETNLAFLAEISHDLAHLTSVDEIMRTVGAKIGAHLKLSACAFVEINDAADEAVVNHAWNRADAVNLTGVYRLGELLTDEFQKAGRAGEMFIVHDTNTDPRTDAAQFAALQIGSFLSIQIIQDGQWRFQLSVYHSTPHDWQTDEIELIRELTTRVWARIERAHTEDALRESEERFRHMADNAPVMVWVTDASGYCNYLSQSWYDFTGQTPQTGLGLGWVDAVHPDDHQYAEETFLVSNEKRSPFSVEYRFRRQDGEYRWAIDSAQPRFSETGEYLGYIGSVVDIHDRKQAETALRESEEKFRDLANSISQLAWMADASGSIFWYNNRWFDYTGTTLEEMRGWGWQTVHHSEELERVTEKFKRHIASGEIWEDTFPLRSRTGEFRWFLSRALPIRNNQGQIVRWFGTNTDVEEFRQARLQAEQANQLKDEFLATLSHELRTPLNAILGWSQVLQNRNLGASETEKALETIERNARAQAQLIDDILDVSRIVTGKLRLDVRAVDLPGVITAAIDAARPGAEAKNIRLQTLLDPQAGPISGDPNRLQQIVWNLLSNAVKFTPKNGRVQVRLERVNSHVEIVVSDTGRGIEAEFLPHVFDRFRQSDGSMTRRHGGLGLGLAIVRQLVELHGGTVAVESAGENQGATFTVHLPLLPMRREAASQTARVHPKAESGALPDCPPELSDLRVLVVEDESDSRDLLNLVLGSCGAVVTTANSAAEALKLIERERFDVVISDIGMPEEDGFSLIGKIRELPDEQGGDVPAIALTAYARAEDRVQALRSGFQMHVAKPVEPAELIAVVANLAGRMRNPKRTENA